MIKTYLILISGATDENIDKYIDTVWRHHKNRCIKQSKNSLILFEKECYSVGTEDLELEISKSIDDYDENGLKIFVYEVKKHEVIRYNEKMVSEMKVIISKLEG